MRISRVSKIAAILFIGLGSIAGQAQVQTYYYSGQVSGFAQMCLTPGPGYTGAFMADFGTISETLYYNSIAQTLEEVGSVTLNPSGNSFNIQNTMVGGPPDYVGSANLTIGNNGCFSFDYTAKAQYPGGTLGGDLLVPVTGSGSYQDQAFAGSWNVDLPLNIQIIAASSTSLTFSQFGDNGLGQVYGVPGQEVLPVSGLYNGLCDGTGDDTYYMRWDQDSIVASAVPDSNSVLIFGLALSALAFLRRHWS
jgi:hypothetical protein